MIPLTLYIHFPWCVRKCPYCDFNSHVSKATLPEEAYIKALMTDFQQDSHYRQHRNIEHIFMGGGTPSLFSGSAIGTLLSTLTQVNNTAEITLEANPGTVEQKRFNDFRHAGINRLSLGVQSFDAKQLKILGRIHSSHEAVTAIQSAKKAGFTNFNIDLMFGLPHQSIENALADLKAAVALDPTHISWYQLTLEPNTPFYYRPPPLPNDDLIWEIQQAGQTYLAEQGYQQYEISAYSQPGYQCQHNVNYWQFGDYLGIGAGAHAKITCPETHLVTRLTKLKSPNTYLKANPNFIAEQQTVKEHLAFEFMLNTLRLYQPFSKTLFEQRTGLSISTIAPQLKQAHKLNLLQPQHNNYQTTELGKRYLNDLLQIFLPSPT